MNKTNHHRARASQRAIEICKSRLLVAGIIFSFAYALLMLRLIDLGFATDKIEPVAQSPSFTLAKTTRADIVDRHGNLLATNLKVASLYADPADILSVQDAAKKLSALFPELDEEKTRLKLESTRRFVWIKRDLTPEQQYQVNRLGLPGLYFQESDRRLYPQGRVTSHLVGYTDIDNNGIAGVEKYFDNRLTEKNEPLELSLDLNLQHILHDELQQAVKKFSATGGVGLVTNVHTGEVLAMVSLPDFDANKQGDEKPNTKFNRATLGIYEMGSTFKIFNTAMALDSGKINLHQKYETKKPIKISRFTIEDFHPQNRPLTVPEIFVYSSNIGSVKMAMEVGTQTQIDFMERLGLLYPPGVELPEVGSPIVPTRWNDINTMTISYGHGIAVSPLQITNAVSAIVNGGIYHPTTIQKVNHPKELVGERIITEKTSHNMRNLLRLVVEHGTGKSARADGYLVGGKTGSAEKPNAGGYKETALISSFVASFPIDDPDYTIFVMLDEPKGRADTFGYATGGWTAAPVVGKVISRTAPLLGVKPVKNKIVPDYMADNFNLENKEATLVSY